MLALLPLSLRLVSELLLLLGVLAGLGGLEVARRDGGLLAFEVVELSTNSWTFSFECKVFLETERDLDFRVFLMTKLLWEMFGLLTVDVKELNVIGAASGSSSSMVMATALLLKFLFGLLLDRSFSSFDIFKLFNFFMRALLSASFTR